MTDETHVAPQHDQSCDEWCNHCTVCGDSIMWGSRCREHPQPPMPLPVIREGAVPAAPTPDPAA